MDLRRESRDLGLLGHAHHDVLQRNAARECRGCFTRSVAAHAEVEARAAVEAHARESREQCFPTTEGRIAGCEFQVIGRGFCEIDPPPGVDHGARKRQGSRIEIDDIARITALGFERQRSPDGLLERIGQIQARVACVDLHFEGELVGGSLCAHDEIDRPARILPLGQGASQLRKLRERLELDRGERQREFEGEGARCRHWPDASRCFEVRPRGIEHVRRELEVDRLFRTQIRRANSQLPDVELGGFCTAAIDVAKLAIFDVEQRDREHGRRIGRRPVHRGRLGARVSSRRLRLAEAIDVHPRSRLNERDPWATKHHARDFVASEQSRPDLYPDHCFVESDEITLTECRVFTHAEIRNACANPTRKADAESTKLHSTSDRVFDLFREPDAVLVEVRIDSAHHEQAEPHEHDHERRRDDGQFSHFPLPAVVRRCHGLLCSTSTFFVTTGGRASSAGAADSSDDRRTASLAGRAHAAIRLVRTYGAFVRPIERARTRPVQPRSTRSRRLFTAY